MSLQVASPLLLAMGILVSYSLPITWGAGDSSRKPAAQANEDLPPARISDEPEKVKREGMTLVDVIGDFKQAGDRIIFFTADAGDRYSCLENLNLERVSQIIADNPETKQWRVSGTITEFRGSNYLLLGRVLLKAKPASRGVPAQTAAEPEPEEPEPEETKPAPSSPESLPESAPAPEAPSGSTPPGAKPSAEGSSSRDNNGVWRSKGAHRVR